MVWAYYMFDVFDWNYDDNDDDTSTEYGSYADDDDEDDDDDDEYDDLMWSRDRQRHRARIDRRRKAVEIRTTRENRRKLATVFELGKDANSRLSRLPHEIVALLLAYCGFSANDLRLVSKGFDRVGMTVRVALPVQSAAANLTPMPPPLERRHFLRGHVTGYDSHSDEHVIRLANGERVKFQVEGIGRNGAHVEFIDDDDDDDDGVSSSEDNGFPLQPSDVSLEWIQRQLFSNAVELSSVEELVFASSQGKTCRACSASIEVDQSQSVRVFIKMGLTSECAADAENRESVESVWASGCHEREFFFYSTLLPNSPQSIAPRCYYARCDADQRQSILVLDDLSPTWKPGDADLGLTQEESYQALGSVALLHASWWNSPSLADYFVDSTPCSMKHVARWPLHIFTDLLRAPSTIEALYRLMPPPSPSITLTVDNLISNLRFIYFRLASRPLTLIHGDLHPNHVYFPRHDDDDDDDNNCVSTATIVDWQQVHPGVAVRDVATLLASTSVDDSADDPSSSYRHLIHFYWTQLNRCVARTDYHTEAAFYDDFRLAVLLHVLELAVAVDVVRSRRVDIDVLRVRLSRAGAVAMAVDSFSMFLSLVAAELGPNRYVLPPPTCDHRVAMVRCRVATGDRAGSFFFGCPYFDVGNECTFFEWTTSTCRSQSSGAPVCAAHNAIGTIRYSLKRERIGRPYYCCSVIDDPCNMFKWAEDGTGSSVVTVAGTRKEGRVCRNWTQLGRCWYGQRCHFSDSHTAANRGVASGSAKRDHSGSTDGDARTTPQQPRCRYWANGRSCPYGPGCYFAYSHV